MKIAILQCGKPPESLIADGTSKFISYGEMIIDMMVRAGMNAQDFEVFDIIGTMQAPSDKMDAAIDTLLARAKQCDSYIISGSKYGVYDNLSWIEKLKQFTHDGFMRHQKKIVGICFGHQMLAESLGGKVEKSSKGWGIGVQHYQLLQQTSDFEMREMLSLYAIHGDQITALPKSPAKDEAYKIEILAASEFCPYAMLYYQGANGGSGFSLQAHPEFSKSYEMALLKLRDADSWSEQAANHALQGIDAPIHANLVTRKITHFLQG